MTSSASAIVFRPSTPADDAALRALLESAGLPAEDVATGPRQRYVLALEGDRLVGSIGVELAGADGLLRSLAVVPDHRGRGLAGALHDRILDVAREQGVRTVYLLTTTAEAFAARRGFERITRAEVPAGIAALAQLRALCPATAPCMRRGVEPASRGGRGSGSPGTGRRSATGPDATGLEDPALTIEQLHRAHGDRVRRYLARLVGAADAEDLAQDVFERAQRAIGTFRGEARVLTWVYRVATNVAIDRLRAAARRADRERPGDGARPPDAPAAADAPSDGSLGGELDRARMRECILRVVEQLPASQRGVILLGDLRGLGDRETAEALGLSLGAAKIRLHRARRALKALLERECTFDRDEQNEFACAPKVGSTVSIRRRSR